MGSTVGLSVLPKESEVVEDVGDVAVCIPSSTVMGLVLAAAMKCMWEHPDRCRVGPCGQRGGPVGGRRTVN
jgi:hypothetical protein